MKKGHLILAHSRIFKKKCWVSGLSRV